MEINVAWHNGQTSWAVDARCVIFYWFQDGRSETYLMCVLEIRCYQPFWRHYYMEINVAWHNGQTSWAVYAHKVIFL